MLYALRGRSFSAATLFADSTQLSAFAFGSIEGWGNELRSRCSTPGVDGVIDVDNPPPTSTPTADQDQ